MIYTCLVHTAQEKYIAAHPAGEAWGSREGVLVEGVWVGVAPYEIVSATVDDEQENVTLDCSFGDLVVPADEIRGSV